MGFWGFGDFLAGSSRVPSRQTTPPAIDEGGVSVEAPAAAASAASAWEWPEAHLKLLAALVQGSAAPSISRLSAAVVEYLASHRPQDASSSSACDDGAAAEPLWLPPASAVASRITLLAEQKSYGHKAHGKAAAAPSAMDSRVPVSQLAGSFDAGAAGLHWHAALSLTRWEVSNTMHLTRSDPKQQAAAMAAVDLSAAPAPSAPAVPAATSPHRSPGDDDDASSNAGGKAAAGAATVRLSAFSRVFSKAATQHQRWLRLCGTRVAAYVRVVDTLLALAAAQSASGERPLPC